MFVENLNNGAQPVYSCDIESKPLILNRENKLVQARKDFDRFTIYLKKISRNRLAAIVDAIDAVESCHQNKHSVICIKGDEIGFGSNRFFEEDLYE